MSAAFKRRLAGEEPVVGTWVTLGDPSVMEILAQAGFDFLLIDAEHAPVGDETLRNLLIAGKGSGTELLVRPLLAGLRQLSGEKIQNYLASELRDRIRRSGARIRILDRSTKKDLEVQPRQLNGRLLHEIGSAPSPRGEICLELYPNGQSPDNQVGLFRMGTRVVPSLAELEALNEEPWNSGELLERAIELSLYAEEHLK